MFLVYIGLFFGLFALFLFAAYSHYERRGTDADNNCWDSWGYFFLIVAVFFIGLSFFETGINYSDQISDSENINKFERLERVYEARADALSQQFATYLADLYPEHERNIFESINPEGIDIYLVKYPDLRASETILELVAQIRSMQDDRYAQQVARENTMKDMRFRMRNPWIFSSFIPER